MAKSKWAGSAAMAALVLGGLSLAACGGGGGGGSAAPPPTAVSPPPPPPPAPPPPASPPPTSQGPTWTQGVFEPSSAFKDQCAVPRSGVDAAGRAFPDQPGSLLEEQLWLRSWTEETYLWYREVADVDPNGFSDVLSYFAVLKTNATTPSGQPRDRFHFTDDTADDLARRLATPAPAYGARLVVVSQSIPRDWRILFTEPNSPASEVIGGQAQLVRGSRILEIDGVDFVNGGTQADVDILNAGLFPDTVGESHTFVVQDPGATSTRTITMTAQNTSASAVNRVEILNTPTGDVGYILFNTFGTEPSEQEIASAMTQLANAGVSDLVLDLRYNGGGFLDISAQTAYMIAGPTRTSNRTYDRLLINDNPDNPFRNATNLVTPFHSTGQGFSVPSTTQLNNLNLSRVFILSTDNTCSASEAVINGLRGINVEVILIGSRTCGKPYGFVATDNCGVTYNTIQFASSNDIGFGDYAEGFAPNNAPGSLGVRIPGCQVDDDIDNELGDPNEAMLAAALNYRQTLSCPTVTSSSASSKVAVVEPGYDFISPDGMISSERPEYNGMIVRLPE